MTQMPQLVALFNGVGGGAAAIVAMIELNEIVDAPARRPATVQLIATAFTIVVGSVSFAGSIVTFLKLQELMTTRPVVFPGYPDPVRRSGCSAAVGFSVGLVLIPSHGRSACCWPWSAPASGVLLVLPVGGADVPIVISLLNAFTGLTVAASGYLLENILLLVAGTLVGSAGTLLTRLMATRWAARWSASCSARSRAARRSAPPTVSDRPVSRRARGRGDPARVRATG